MAKATKKKNPSAPGFAERLRHLRIQKGLSQADLGKLVSIHQNQIGRYELGTAQPSADNINNLAEALGVSGDFLFKGDTEGAVRVSFEDREFLEMFKKAEKLPKEDQTVIKKLIGAFLNQKQIDQMATK